MQNIGEIMKEFGLEIPEEKQAEFNKKVTENYKTVAEVEKRIGRIEGERDEWKSKAETAETTLKGFEGLDREKIDAELAEYKRRAEEAERTYQQKIEKREFDDALTSALNEVRFTSASARKAVEAEIRAKNLTMSNGRIIGLNDVIDDIKSKDASAFVDEEKEKQEQGKAKFTKPTNPQSGGNRLTMAEIMRLKNSDPNFDFKQYLK